jgi:uncharacterized membrane protein (DUF2068 family)
VSERLPRDKWVMLIGIGKILKTIALVAVGTAALMLVHHDVAEELRHWALILGLAPGGHLVREALAGAGALDDRLLREIGVLLFVYAALFAFEGAGLLLRKPCGEWVSIFITGSFIPIEIYESARHPHVGRVITLLVNIAAVAYLVHRVRVRKQGEKKEKERGEAGALRA